MSWLFGTGAGAGAAGAGAGTAAGTAGAAGAGAGAASAAAPAATAGMVGGAAAPYAGAALNAAQPVANSGLGQFLQGLGQGTFGYGQAPNTFWGQFGQQLGQPAPRQPMPTLPPAIQVGQQPLGPLFQRPSQGMDPQLLQQIGMLVLGMRR